MREQKKFWMIGISILILVSLSGNVSASLGSQGFPVPDFEREEYGNAELHVMQTLESALEKNPESALYGLSVALDRIRISLTIDSERRAELKERFAWERLKEAHHLMKQNKTSIADNILEDNEREIKGLLEATSISEQSLREHLGKPVETPSPSRIIVDENRTLPIDPDRRDEITLERNETIENKTETDPLDVAKNVTERIRNNITDIGSDEKTEDDTDIIRDITDPLTEDDSEEEKSIINNAKDTLPGTDENKNIGGII